jgi:hypothetical protein
MGVELTSHYHIASISLRRLYDLHGLAYRELLANFGLIILEPGVMDSGAGRTGILL